VEVDRVARLDRREEVDVVVDPEVGWWPPCIRRPVPPIASVSSIFLKMHGFGRTYASRVSPGER
jgi:hypothetical protein